MSLIVRLCHVHAGFGWWFNISSPRGAAGVTQQKQRCSTSALLPSDCAQSVSHESSKGEAPQETNTKVLWGVKKRYYCLCSACCCLLLFYLLPKINKTETWNFLLPVYQRNVLRRQFSAQNSKHCCRRLNADTSESEKYININVHINVLIFLAICLDIKA